MIRSEREYHLTMAQLERFREALEALMEGIAMGHPLPEGYDPMIPEVERRALLSQMEELQDEVRDWRERRHD